MNTKFLTVIAGGIILTLGLVGCGTNSSSTPSQSSQPAHTHSDSSSDDSKTTTASNDQLKKAFQDELNGFTTIQQDISNDKFEDASKLANQLHDEFHAAILPPLTDKKGQAYAEDIHGKYDELQDAITSKNKDNIAKLLKVNQDNLKTAAQILGVSL